MEAARLRGRAPVATLRGPAPGAVVLEIFVADRCHGHGCRGRFSGIVGDSFDLDR